MKSKKELMDALNKLVIQLKFVQFFLIFERVWEDQEFQKKFASTIGFKPKDVILTGLKRNKSSYLFLSRN